MTDNKDFESRLLDSLKGEFATQRRIGRADHQRHAMQRRGAMACAAVVVVGAVGATAILTTTGSSKSPEIASPSSSTTQTSVATKDIATSELGKLFLQAAAAQRPAGPVTTVWYTKTREEQWPMKGTSGPHSIEEHEAWSRPDGSGHSAVDGTFGHRETNSAPDAFAREFWQRATTLPTDPAQLRDVYVKAAEKEQAEWAGKRTPIGEVTSDPQKQVQQITARNVLLDLSYGPMTSEARAAAYRFLAELADQGIVTDSGVTQDALGRTGHVFTGQFTGSEEGVYSYMFDPNTGDFLQMDFSLDGQLSSRTTYEDSGFVSEVGSRP